MAIYRSRLVDQELEAALKSAGAVLLEGPRGCGKTATGRQHSASEVLLDTDETALELARLDPSVVLEGATPRLIDEWQLEPRLWNHVRRAVDDRQDKGQFILAGSSVPDEDQLRHSGAARILRLRMRTMSMAEAELSTAQVSLQALLAGEPLQAGVSAKPLSVVELAEVVSKGGWPGMQDIGADEAQRLLRSYLEDIARIDLPRLEGRERRDPIMVRRTLTSLARHSATEVTYSTIANDIGSEGQPARIETVAEYISLLERIFVIEQQPSWGPHLRSRDRIRKRPKLHFIDPALAVAGIGGSPQMLLQDLHTFGLLFESLAIRDLKIYGQRADAYVSHYRDSSGTEVDAVVATASGRWLAAEIKLGSDRVDAAAASLIRFRDKLDVQRTELPSALVVLTTGNYAYRRPDGVTVVPLAMLGP